MENKKAKIKVETVLYNTTDLYLAAFLKVRRWYVRIERTPEKKEVLFSFVDDPDLQKDIVEYFNGADVSAIAFKNELQNLKTLMYNT